MSYAEPTVSLQALLNNESVRLTPGPITVDEEAAWLDLGNVGFQATGDRVFIIEDDFRSGYECEVCGGKQKVVCDDCNGKGVSPVNPEIRCKSCEGRLLVTCPKCEGKGGLLIIPDNAQRRPTTGVIRSIGPGVWQNGTFIPTTYKVGEGVVYSNFAGHAWDIDGQVVRILHEVELFGRIRGHLTLVTAKASREMPDSHDSFNASMLDRGRS